MFVPVDREITLRLSHGENKEEDTQVNCVTCNREKNLVAVILNCTLQIWLTHPQLLLCTVTLPESDVRDRGTLQKAFWKFDSTYIAVSTSRNSILVFRVHFLDDDCYHLRDPNDANFQRMSQELFLRCPRPSISLMPSVVMNLAAAATCCVPLRDEILVCLKNGFCHHIAWDGTVHSDYSIKLASVPFAHDQLQSKPDYLNDPTIHVVSAVYAPLVGGYCIVLSDGRAALLTSSDSRFHPNSLLGVWALHLKDAVCCDVNHKFRLLVFGCTNGDVCAFHLDDSNGSIVQTFRVPLRIRDGPDITSKIGPVVDIQVLSGGSAFGAVWKSKEGSVNLLPPTSAIFTPFGSQTFCSLESLPDSDSSLESEYTSVEWGPEGYYLLFGKNNGFSCLSIAHSASVSNPSMYHSDQTVLLCSNKVMISPPRHREASATAPNSVWTTLTIPNEYIAANWPIRIASLDNETSKVLVIAGAKGLAHCNVTTGKWRIFGNESQERDILVTGGVFVWDKVLGAASFDADSGKESLRFYPLSTKLDNSYASVIETDSRVVMLSSRRDSLVTFDVDTKIMLYKIHLIDTNVVDSFVKVELDRLAEIRVSDLITHPACLVSIHLTQLSLEKDAATFMPFVDTVLVNISGRLITLNPKNVAKEDDERFQLNQPIMVASFVEHIWHDPVREEITPSSSRSNGNSHNVSEESGASHLEHALWINCGSKGMRVWLPLFPSRRTTTAQDTSFISKRIMLPFELDIVPIVISSMDCLAIGLESVPQSISAYSSAKGVIYSVHRNSEVFVHHLLRQLLKRNLGVFALEMAANCRNLPHFPHSLELLLHGVLEEEATSSEPIPDPLLPRCIAFIQEFPENLKTIAHCARKTELALWSSLFAVTGPPNDLFENCLRDGQLHTAASYLIILQSMENANTSLEQASRLLTEALSVGDWTIVKDMMRFARSIDADDMDDRPIRTPPPSKPSSRRPTASISLNGSEANELVFSRFQAVGRVNKVRTSLEHKESTRKDSSGSGRRVGRVQSSDGGPPSPSFEPNSLAERMDHIVQEHALRLLDEYCIRDLGYLCSHLNLDIRHLVLQRPVADYSLALTRLHSQFGWPYPVPGKHVVDQLEKRFGSMRTSRSTASLNGACLLESPLSKSTTRQKSELVNSIIPAEITDETDTLSIKEAKLRPLGYQDSGSDSLMQERAPSPGGSSVSQTMGTPDTRSVDWQGVDLLVGESSVRGSSESQAQLNHMLRLFSDIGAVEWVFLLCVVARDSVSLRREISPANITKWGIETFGYARLGCLDMIKWAETNCIGYVPILHIFSAHLNLVAEQAGCLNLPPRRIAHTQQIVENGDLKLADVPRKARNPRDLNSSYRRRDRSQSVDRGHLVNGNDESDGCSIM